MNTAPTTADLAAQHAANDRRGDYITGLRAIADMLEENPGVPLPASAMFNTFFFGDDAKLTMAASRRAIGGEWTKGGTETFFYLRHYFGPHQYDINTQRDLVCERVVTGTEHVEVPDPDAPKVTIDREIVEWKCSPLLDDPTDQQRAS